MRKSETKTLNAANSILDSFQASGLEEPQRAMSTRNSTGCIHSKVGSSEERSGNLEQWSNQESERHMVDSQAEVRMPEERHRPMIGWNTNTRILRDFWDEMGKTAECAACASPGKKHSVACLNRQEEWKTRTIPQSERVTRETSTETQQDTKAPASSSCTKDRNSRDRLRKPSETLTNQKLATTNLRIPESGHPRNVFD